MSPLSVPCRLAAQLVVLVLLAGCGPSPSSIPWKAPSTDAPPPSPYTTAPAGSGLQFTLPASWKWVANQDQLDALIATLDAERAATLRAWSSNPWGTWLKPGAVYAIDTSSEPLPGGGLAYLWLGADPGPATLEALEAEQAEAMVAYPDYASQRLVLPGGAALRTTYQQDAKVDVWYTFLVAGADTEAYQQVWFAFRFAAAGHEQPEAIVDQAMRTLRFESPITAIP